MRIGVDLMGSESSPEVLFEAVLNAVSYLSEQDSIVVFLTHTAVGRIFENERFRKLLDQNSGLIDLHPVKDEIAMGEDPLSSLRLKKEASLVVAIHQIQEKKIDALVSAGNTGALIGAATLFLPKMKLERCCLLASLPTKKDPLAVLDVGGFLTPTPAALVHYAQVGAAYQRILLGKKTPHVGLMNIGVESEKGTDKVKEAYHLLASDDSGSFRFVGNVEGRDAFQGEVDVLVTDGFTGNVLLKVSQGVSSFIFDHLKTELKNVSDPAVQHSIDELHRHFRYDEHPGAFLCGVEGIIIKCHGAATVRSLTQSILGARRLVKAQMIRCMKDEFYA